MRLFYLHFVLFVSIRAVGQETKTAEVRNAIDGFFEEFHKRDTTKLRSMLAKDATLHSIATNREGKAILRAESMDAFLASIANLPDTLQFEEKLLDYEIQVDGNMAHAWTPYSFYLGGSFHHCGVNSFQLFKAEDGWRILHLSDTRRVEGCDEKSKP